MPLNNAWHFVPSGPIWYVFYWPNTDAGSLGLAHPGGNVHRRRVEECSSLSYKPSRKSRLPFPSGQAVRSISISLPNLARPRSAARFQSVSTDLQPVRRSPILYSTVELASLFSRPLADADGPVLWLLKQRRERLLAPPSSAQIPSLTLLDTESAASWSRLLLESSSLERRFLTRAATTLILNLNLLAPG